MKEPSLFTRKLRKFARDVPSGRVTTYGLLARAAGGGGQAARSVSSILSKDPKSHEIPWHRIVYSNGRVWLSDEYNLARMKLYKKEGIEVDKKGKIQNFRDILWAFGSDI